MARSGLLELLPHNPSIRPQSAATGNGASNLPDIAIKIYPGRLSIFYTNLNRTPIALTDGF